MHFVYFILLLFSLALKSEKKIKQNKNCDYTIAGRHNGFFPLHLLVLLLLHFTCIRVYTHHHRYPYIRAYIRLYGTIQISRDEHQHRTAHTIAIPCHAIYYYYFFLYCFVCHCVKKMNIQRNHEKNLLRKNKRERK